MDMPSAILFACTRNSIRSPMAEGIMKYLYGHNTYVDSVGVHDGEIDGYVIAVMDEIGIDVSRHHAKTFDDLEDSSFDIIISLSPEAQHKAVDLTQWMACEIEFWNTFDPSLERSEDRERVLHSYRNIRDQLLKRIKSRFPLHSVHDT